MKLVRHDTELLKNPLTDSSLAITGGDAAFSIPVPSWPTTSEQIRNSIENALADGSWGKYEARWTEQLVEALRKQFLREHVFLCSSGTIAVEMALRGLSIGPGDEVIMAGYDFPGNFRAIEAVGAFPVLVDVMTDGWVIDATQIAAAISDKTKAIIVTHLHGQIADMRHIRAELDDHTPADNPRIAIVEDVCQTPGGRLDGNPLATFGDVAVLSFGGSKLLSAGRGGGVVTDSAEILQRIRIYNSRGNEAFPMSQLQAAALLPQVEELDRLTLKRHETAKQLLASIANVANLHGLNQIVGGDRSEGLLPAYYKLPWLLKDRPTGWSRPDFIAAVQAEGIPMDVGFRGFLRRSAKRCRKVGVLPNCQVAAQQTLLLHHPILLLDGDDIATPFARAIRKVIESSH